MSNLVDMVPLWRLLLEVVNDVDDDSGDGERDWGFGNVLGLNREVDDVGGEKGLLWGFGWLSAPGRFDPRLLVDVLSADIFFLAKGLAVVERDVG